MYGIAKVTFPNICYSWNDHYFELGNGTDSLSRTSRPATVNMNVQSVPVDTTKQHHWQGKTMSCSLDYTVTLLSCLITGFHYHETDRDDSVRLFIFNLCVIYQHMLNIATVPYLHTQWLRFWTFSLALYAREPSHGIASSFWTKNLNMHFEGEGSWTWLWLDVRIKNMWILLVGWMGLYIAHIR